MCLRGKSDDVCGSLRVMRVPSELPGWLTLAVRAVAAGVFFGGLAKSVLLSWPQGILAVAEDVADG